MKHLMIAALVLCAPAATAAANDAPRVYSPAEAIELAKAKPSGRTGRFEMVVMSTGVTPKGTFLNSTADYRGDDNLTVRLTPIVARHLGARYGAPADQYFTGKRIVVDGRIAQKPIANTLYGRARSLNRFQHEVDLTQIDQLVSVTNP